MRESWRYELAGLALFVGSVYPAHGMDGIASHGSLAVFVPTASGLVVCTDKREWNPIRGASDTEMKIYAIDSKGAFTITGSVAVLDPSTLRPLFSVKELAIKYLKDETTQPLVERIQGLPKALNDAYIRFRQGGGRGLERSPGATDDVITSITVWYTHKGRVHVSQVQLHDTGDTDFRGFSEKDTTAEFNRKFEIEGQTEFILAAIRNSDPRFKTFKADPDIKTVWTSKNPMDVTPALAVKFGRKIIRATNEFHHLVSPAPTMVSAESDCSLINPSRGFESLK
jgi:hypothetical protein